MLRVTVEIVPHGVEEEKKVIGTMEVGNIGVKKDHGFGHQVCAYLSRIWEDDEDKPSLEDSPVTLHDRRDGAWRLVQRVLDQRYGPIRGSSDVVVDKEPEKETDDGAPPF